MTNQELYDLIACFERSSLGTLKLSRQDFSIELSRGGGTAPAGNAPIPAGVSAAPAPVESPAVTAPLVGAFYTAPAPDQPPFAPVGAHIKKGQTVCLIEAMKMMSEVLAPCDCVIEAVLKADGELAAFGEPLLRYQPC
ncbi:biotin/lipoyl-containing protein [Oscillibacter sp.]|uniref:acetyl-CoA carboxylase biotin carboxyl carrier protein n=1 Tax=Oscillibacter sp. TaxID=1945593 RepID=UPI002613CD0F|nr:biotin/lipoyl-containing protein [Oscillibacter sp.]MDD3347259.1 acetyl-CoA carboxylase biotin carboxyl carrier protein subunit [Oscillibacter sp.]